MEKITKIGLDSQAGCFRSTGSMALMPTLYVACFAAMMLKALPCLIGIRLARRGTTGLGFLCRWVATFGWCLHSYITPYVKRQKNYARNARRSAQRWRGR